MSVNEPVITIRKGGTTAEINPLNSQMFSLKRKGIEVMSGGGAPNELQLPDNGWKNSEFLMYPIVGKAVDAVIVVGGVESTMTQHGTVRYKPKEGDWWKIKNRDKHSVTMELTYEAGTKIDDGKGTVSSFPISYRIAKTYSIDEAGEFSLKIEVENLSDKDLPYSLGWHPALKAVKQGTIKVTSGEGEQKHESTVTLEEVRAANGNVIEFENANMLLYKNPEFTVVMNHNFGKAQVWNNGEGLIALEPITARSMSRTQLTKERKELSQQEGYRVLRAKEKQIFEVSIQIAVRKA